MMGLPNTMAVLDDTTLLAGVTALCNSHPVFAEVIKRHGLPTLRQSEGGLGGLLRMVTEQFLSLRAAAAIWTRLEQRLLPLEADVVLACPLEELVSLGLSNAKARSFHGLAAACQTGLLDFAELHQLSDDLACKKLVSLPGIGPWTAEIYLLSVMLRSNAWPWGDVALQAAAQDLFNLPARPDKAAMLALGAGFEPFRAVAARLLWSHYRGLKKMSQAV